MNDEQILEVGLDAERLFIRPASRTFDQIFRAAMGVSWDPTRRALVSSQRHEWTMAQWFEQVLSAVAVEYGVALRLASSTVWTGITSDQQRDMVAFANSDWFARLCEEQSAKGARALRSLLFKQALAQAADHWAHGRWDEYVRTLVPVRDQLSTAQAKRLLIAERRTAS